MLHNINILLRWYYGSSKIGITSCLSARLGETEGDAPGLLGVGPENNFTGIGYNEGFELPASHLALNSIISCPSSNIVCMSEKEKASPQVETRPHRLSLLDKLPPWISNNLRSKRQWKMLVRCWVASWAAFILLLPNNSLQTLGNACVVLASVRSSLKLNQPAYEQCLFCSSCQLDGRSKYAGSNVLLRELPHHPSILLS